MATSAPPTPNHRANDAEHAASSRAPDDDRPPDARRAADRQRRGARQASPDRRSPAEWVTLIVSSGIVLTLVGVATFFALTGSGDPAIVEANVRTAEAYRGGARYYLPLTIRNVGGQTGEDVRVRVTLADASGRAESVELAIPFLAGGSSTRAVAVFGSDPAQGHVTADVVSYLEP